MCNLPNTFRFWDDFGFYKRPPGLMVVKGADVNRSRIVQLENPFVNSKIGTRNLPNIIGKRAANPGV